MQAQLRHPGACAWEASHARPLYSKNRLLIKESLILAFGTPVVSQSYLKYLASALPAAHITLPSARSFLLSRP